MRIRTHTNPLSYTQRMDQDDLKHRIKKLTDSYAPLCLEIGCGRGVFFRHYAKQHPKTGLIGVEVRKQASEILQGRIEKEGIENADVFHGPASIFIEDLISEHSLSSVFIFHPDPWFKKRHQNRRIVSDKLLALLHRSMKENAKLYVSTDVESLWHDMKDLILASPYFELSTTLDPFWETDYQSHWDAFSQEEARSRFKGTFLRREH